MELSAWVRGLSDMGCDLMEIADTTGLHFLDVAAMLSASQVRDEWCHIEPEQPDQPQEPSPPLVTRVCRKHAPNYSKGITRARHDMKMLLNEIKEAYVSGRFTKMDQFLAHFEISRKYFIKLCCMLRPEVNYHKLEPSYANMTAIDLKRLKFFEMLDDPTCKYSFVDMAKLLKAKKGTLYKWRATREIRRKRLEGA